MQFYQWNISAFSSPMLLASLIRTQGRWFPVDETETLGQQQAYPSL